MAAAGRTLAGVEVPFVGCEKIKWTRLSVLSSHAPFSSESEPLAPIVSRDVASCHVIDGSPPVYLFWRIHQNDPNVIEVLQLFAGKGIPDNGLHLVFQDELSPFAFICTNESAGGDGYLLYVLTVSGVAYLLNLRRSFSYISGSNIPGSDVIEVVVTPHIGKITSAAATFGCLLIGHTDGSIRCHQLGKVDPDAQGFMSELRDDMGIGRLWSLMSRGKAVGSVQDMVISEHFQRKLLFVLHSDGSMRVWDFLSHSKIFNYNIFSHMQSGISPSRLCVGDINHELSSISLAVLHGSSSEPDTEMITVCNFGFTLSDKLVFSSDPTTQSISLDQAVLIDMKISSGKLWILKEVDFMLYDLSVSSCTLESTCTYSLQEEFVADQLFQGSENVLDDMIWTNESILTSLKVQIAHFISSIYLRRLMQPGVYQSDALRATVLDYKKYNSDSEFQSLTLPALKKEIFATIESEGAAATLSSIVLYWKNFCNRFFRYWCQNHTPYGLLVDSSNDVIGIIRKCSFSLFRSLEVSERLMYGTCDNFNDFKNSGPISPDNDVDSEFLFDLLRCTSCINHQLGRAAVAVYYESLINPAISSDDTFFQILKIIETGCSPSSSRTHIGDSNRQKRQLAHKRQRKFSVEMFLSLKALYERAGTWARVFDVVEAYLKYLSPHKRNENLQSQRNFNMISSLLVQSTSQVTRVMFESLFDLLLVLCYMVDISGKIDMVQADVVRIKVEFVPKIQKIMTQWLILHYLASTPTTPLIIEDFSSRLSSLHIGNIDEIRSVEKNLGLSNFTLACLLDFPRTNEDEDLICSSSFPRPSEIILTVQNFCSLIIWGRTCNSMIELASVLLRHRQYEAAENLLIIDAYSSKRRLSSSAQSNDSDQCAHLHLLGFCLLSRAHYELHGDYKEQKVCEAIRCFFRVASGKEALQALQNIPFQTGLEYTGVSESLAVWKLHYYQWAMQIFEQYGLSEGACQFALAALEQVDDVTSLENSGNDGLQEAAKKIKGRLWGNVFKFFLDLKNYRDAYCALISNPDEDSKTVNLRRFIIVLCEHGAAKILCDGSLPLVGLTTKVEQELVWKAERSEVFAKPNLYKLLYAFEAYRNNWRKAASYMYRYAARLKKEATSDDTSSLQERLNAISTTINALQLVDSKYAWIESQLESGFCNDQGSPVKRTRNSLVVRSSVSASNPQSLHYNVDIETLEKEYLLTSAQCLLTNAKIKYSGHQTPEILVGILIEENFYDMAFTVIMKFWRGSALNRQLEEAFISISQQCCSSNAGSSFQGSELVVANFVLPSSESEKSSKGKKKSRSVCDLKGNIGWESLELHLEKYRKVHPRLVVTVAETLVDSDPEIDLPVWLVEMFKAGPWGMTGHEADRATLFRLYVNYGRVGEATNLLLEHLESFASKRAGDVINRKRMSAIWFPYTAIEQLWCQLVEMQNAGHMVNQCRKLKELLNVALLNHLSQVKVDSEDAVSAACRDEMEHDLS